MNILYFIFLNFVRCQCDWTGGAGVFSPVSDWGNRFSQSESVTINTPNQISPIASGSINPSGWTKHIIDTDPYIYNNGIWPADFDNDGHIDLAGWKSYSGQLVFYKNNGSDSFLPVDTFFTASGSQWAFIYGADLDNDGKTDIVVPCGYLSDSLYWYKNNGNFNFTKRVISGGNTYCLVDGADIDHSGHISLVATRTYVGCTEIWKNNGGGDFTLSQTLPDSSWRARFVDVNNDGNTDLVLGDMYGTNKNYRVLLNNGTGYFNTASLDTFASGWSSNDALWDGDINNDGRKDLIVGVMGGSNEIWWMENNGIGMGWTRHIVHTGDTYYSDGGCIEDFDFDGKADIASGFNTRLAWFKQVNLDSFVEYVIDASASITHWVIPFKIGTAGNANLLVCWQGSFAWYENNVVAGNFSNGSLTSSILKMQGTSVNFNWQYFGWKTSCPFSNAISFQLRSGTDSANITGKSFSTPIVITPATQFDSISLSSYTQSTDRFFQYKVNFVGGTNVGIVDSVWVACLGTGISETTNLKEFFKVYPGKICYSLVQDSKTTLSIYNVSGRLVKILDKGEKVKGIHWINVPSLPAGAYLVILNINGRNFTKKMVVIK
jgi:hypothetical protein